MKNKSIGFYHPSKEEYETLWGQAIFVFDANVLLSLYRYKVVTRRKLLGLIEKMKDRVWIPYHVLLEFHRNRDGVISSERKSTEDTLKNVSDSVQQVKTKVYALKIEERDVEYSPDKLFLALDEANSAIVKVLEEVHKQQQGISLSSDAILETLYEIFHEKVGIEPKVQDDICNLVRDGETRYSNRIPPGYADDIKERKDPTFVDNGLLYERKFGDLIIWRQIIEYVKTNSLKNVIFVTGDRKHDWWLLEDNNKNKVIGPQPELVKEIFRETDIELFWMYSAEKFFELAGDFFKDEVSEESLSEIKENSMIENSHEKIDVPSWDQENWSELTDSASESMKILTSHRSSSRWRNSFQHQDDKSISYDLKVINNIVGRWFEKPSTVYYNNAGVDFLVDGLNGPFGCEVILCLNGIERELRDKKTVDYIRSVRGKLKFKLCVIFVSDEFDLTAPIFSTHHDYNGIIEKLINILDLDRVITGYISDGEFIAVTEKFNSFSLNQF